MPACEPTAELRLWEHEDGALRERAMSASLSAGGLAVGGARGRAGTKLMEDAIG